jgi:transcriptional regulator with XRE-family HTH domain
MGEPVEYVVGRRLRRRRRLMGLTQSELGALCGVSFQQVQKYESAHTRLSIGMLWKLACALEVDVSYFFADAPRALIANEGRRLPAVEALSSANAA